MKKTMFLYFWSSKINWFGDANNIFYFLITLLLKILNTLILILFFLKVIFLIEQFPDLQQVSCNQILHRFNSDNILTWSYWVAGGTASKLAGRETSTLNADTVTERLSADQLNSNIMTKLQNQENNDIVMTKTKSVRGKTLEKATDQIR